MPLIETRGAGSAQGFGEFAQSAAPVYIEDVFSTYLYTGNSSTQTITNGIDLSGKGGLVWIKVRNQTYNHYLSDSASGVGSYLSSNSTNAQNAFGAQTDDLTSFNSNGFSLGADGNLGWVNASGSTYASWTFREQAKFFDVVTYTGNGQNDRQISHNLGSTPGCIIVKCLFFSGSGGPANWSVYHRSISPSQSLFLNTTAAAATNDGLFGTPTSTYFVVNQPGGGNTLNSNGQNYVAYLFAHNAGGFGLSGSDNVISCGSLSGAGTTVNLGYEPQWILAKRTDTTGNWYIDDNMRGWPAAPGNDNPLLANSSAAEPTGYAGFANITSTGFTNNFNGDYIYIAIRRGPMKVPTSGTSVFSPQIWTGTGTTQQITTGFFPDMFIGINRGAVHAKTYATDILRGLSVTLATNVTDAENSESGNTFNMTGYSNNNGNLNSTFGGGQTYVGEFFRRAPGFFDVVCYTGTSTGSRAVTHNLGVAPEMVIVKQRTAVGSSRSWWVLTTSGPRLNILNDNSAANAFGVPANLFGDATFNNYIAPTATTVTLSPSDEVNNSSNNYVMYLFATLAGVSKVGSYTGTGTTKQIDCGFTGGARFVLIKRTDSTGDWYVWDTARGIVSGNDPYLLLNSTAAEVTNTDYVDTYSAGFELSSTAPAALNANGGSFIFFAVA